MQTETIYRTALIAMSVFTITYYGTPFGGEVNTDLVGASGFEMELDEGISNPSRPPLKGGEVSAAGFPPLRGGMGWGCCGL